MKNILHWGRKVQVGKTRQEAYYDITEYDVPVTFGCPDGELPDGAICPKCGGSRQPSGVNSGTWVHSPRKINVYAVYSALRDRYFPPHHNVFGGYCSLGTVTDNGNGTVRVEVIYHIGE